LNSKLLRHVAELEDMNRERQNLLARLVGAQEEERKRIASDIHDDSVQVMTAAGMRLEMLARRIEDPAILAELDVLQKTVRLAIGRLRHMVFQLRPLALDRDGLAAAIDNYLLQDSGQSGYTYTINDRIATEPSPEIRVILYRVAQEAFTNVVKHAGARTISVDLEQVDDGYRMRIADDGIGFEVDAVPSNSNAGHIGLPSMRERVAMAGGRCTIQSRPGEGTIVEFWVPSRERAGHSPAPAST
jgi:signal transduction histidine kinase